MTGQREHAPDAVSGAHPWECMRDTHVRDLTTVNDRNPTKVLAEHFDVLMAEDDPQRLAQDIIELVRDHSQISEKNLQTHINRVIAIGMDLDRLRQYVANYILAGCGLAVIKVGV